MSGFLDDFMVHEATVEPYRGTSGSGVELYGPPVTVPCFAEGARRLLRGGDGEQVVSNTTLYTAADKADLFAPRSRVTQAGVESRVITANAATLSADFPEHAAIYLE